MLAGGCVLYVFSNKPLPSLHHRATAAAVRLMVSRGLKPTPYQSPGITLGQPVVVIVPEYKEAAPGPKVWVGLVLSECGYL